MTIDISTLEQAKNLLESEEELKKLTDIEEAKDAIAAITAIASNLENDLTNAKKANTKLKDQWKKLTDGQAEEIKQAEKNAKVGLFGPKSEKLPAAAIKHFGMVTKEDFEKLQAELQALKNNSGTEEAVKHFKELYEAEKAKNDNHVCPVSDNSALQDQLTAWDKAFDGRTSQEAKDYWDFDGERIQQILTYHKEKSERLLKESTTHKTMYAELRPTLSRANFKIEELEDKLSKYEPHDDSWVSQVQIPHKS